MNCPYFYLGCIQKGCLGKGKIDKKQYAFQLYEAHNVPYNEHEFDKFNV